MIKRKNKRADEENKKEDDPKSGADPAKPKKCAGELRLQKEFTELDIPEYGKITF